ncbi:MAG: multidrug transporter AcrB, partial [Gammaproteobacteria bacterium HGW-Gammaproteobacteria-7]
DWVPPGLGVGQPLVQPMGIDDVPVLSLTLWATDGPSGASAQGAAWRGATELAEVAHTLESELKRVPGTRDIFTVGAPDRAVLVQLDAARLSAYGLVVEDISGALQAANLVTEPGERVAADGVRQLSAGTFLADAQEIADLTIGLNQGKPVFLSDVADITRGADLPSRYVWHGAPEGRAGRPPEGIAPAVTLAVAKKPGSNAADITRAVIDRVEALKGSLIPAGVEVTVTRDYGFTANDKAATLIKKLIFATSAVVLLVLVALGWREAVVVGTAVVLTLALTLFASWAMGFTINRVSLFALIFAIGILVDDAIVVVENIHRHMRRGGKSLLQAIPPAVDEVGSPTILATFTVIAALLPMAFVTGLMGPYMRPIPINASVGMLLSLAVALTVTPWLALKLLRGHGAGLPSPTGRGAGGEGSAEASHDGARVPSPQPLSRGERGYFDPHALFHRLLTPFLDPTSGTRRRRGLFVGIAALVLIAVGLAGVQWVVLKMLPFDNKSEFQIIVD